MSGTCSTHVRHEKRVKILVRKSDRKYQLREYGVSGNIMSNWILKKLGRRL
jgi:hypothetical protein